MILLNIYLVLFALLAIVLWAIYTFLYQPLKKANADREEQERQIQEMRRREADLTDRLRKAARQELEKECGPLKTHLGEIPTDQDL
jgi:type II secretory pathway component PulJ